MIKKIKEYLEYRKNKKTAKRVLVRIAAALLPAVQNTAEKGSDIINFIIRLAGAAKDMNGERLVKYLSSTLRYNKPLLHITVYCYYTWQKLSLHKIV